MTLTSRVEFTAREGRREEFIQAAKALAAATHDEPGTLRYDWYQDADPDSFVVIEEYVDSAAAFAHNAHCDELLKRAFELGELTAMQLHGDISPELQAFADNMPGTKTFPPLA